MNLMGSKEMNVKEEMMLLWGYPNVGNTLTDVLSQADDETASHSIAMIMQMCFTNDKPLKAI